MVAGEGISGTKLNQILRRPVNPDQSAVGIEHPDEPRAGGEIVGNLLLQLTSAIVRR